MQSDARCLSVLSLLRNSSSKAQRRAAAAQQLTDLADQLHTETDRNVQITQSLQQEQEMLAVIAARLAASETATRGAQQRADFMQLCLQGEQLLHANTAHRLMEVLQANTMLQQQQQQQLAAAASAVSNRSSSHAHWVRVLIAKPLSWAAGAVMVRSAWGAERAAAADAALAVVLVAAAAQATEAALCSVWGALRAAVPHGGSSNSSNSSRLCSANAGSAVRLQAQAALVSSHRISWEHEDNEPLSSISSFPIACEQQHDRAVCSFDCCIDSSDSEDGSNSICSDEGGALAFILPGLLAGSSFVGAGGKARFSGTGQVAWPQLGDPSADPTSQGPVVMRRWSCPA